MSVKRLCKVPCCSRFRVDGSNYCEKHKEKYEAIDKKKEEERAKNRFANRTPSIYSQFYQSARWHRESSEFLKENPYCEMCGGKATHVHHEYPNNVKYDTEALYYDRTHWIPLCKSCHFRLHEMKRRNQSLN